MNRDEARQFLLLYRPGSADATDPQVAEALALAKNDAELARWLDAYGVQQQILRAKFRQAAPPAGLKEQIISEHAARRKIISSRRRFALAAAAALLMVCAGLWLRQNPSSADNVLASYQARMVRDALTGYAMDLETNSLAPLRAYLAQRQSPADFVLPAGLQNALLTGCAVEKWQGANVTLICFRTGQPLRPGESSDLWLFVVNRGSVKAAPQSTTPELTKVNRLMTATWVDGDKLYLLGVAGNEQTIRAYL